MDVYGCLYIYNVTQCSRSQEYINTRL